MRRAGAVLVLLILGAVPAHASPGVSVGPARQLVQPRQHLARVYVVNPTDAVVEVYPSTWAYDGQRWVQRPVSGLLPGRGFELDPGEQREVVIAVPTSDAPCRLVGVGFSVRAESASGVRVLGTGLAQLALRGRGATEADCLAVLPRPPAGQGGGPSRVMIWAFAAGLLVCLLALVRQIRP